LKSIKRLVRLHPQVES